ncbi:hypothetical protein D3C73_1347740 [compost metagenome]
MIGDRIHAVGQAVDDGIVDAILLNNTSRNVAARSIRLHHHSGRNGVGIDSARKSDSSLHIGREGVDLDGSIVR